MPLKRDAVSRDRAERDPEEPAGGGEAVYRRANPFCFLSLPIPRPGTLSTQLFSLGVQRNNEQNVWKGFLMMSTISIVSRLCFLARLGEIWKSKAVWNAYSVRKCIKCVFLQ